MVPYIKASLLGLSGMAHYHLEVQANKKMAPKIDAILTCMGETGLSHDITSKSCLQNLRKLRNQIGTCTLRGRS